MTRFFGKVGYATPVRSDGVVENVITEHQYYGEILRSMRYFRDSTSVQGEVSQQTRISIIADAYALGNYEDIRYVEKGGTLWDVESIEQAERPRLILVLGDKYDGPVPE